MRIIWRAEALRHLDNIRRYIARDNPSKALDVWERIFAYAEQELLATDDPSTERGRDGRVRGTRELVVADYRNYIIVYRVKEGAVEVLAVRHGKRRWPRSFR